MNLKNIPPKLYAGVAIAGVGITAYLSARGALQAEKRIAETGAVTKREKFKAAFPCYIGAIASGGVTIASILGGFNDLIRRNTEFAIAYGFGQTVIRLYSERTPMETRKQISNEVIQMQEPAIGELIPLDTTSGPNDKITEWSDYLSDRTFHASKNQVISGLEEFTETILKVNGYGSLNQLYVCFHNPDELGTIGFMGDILGWKYVNEQGPIPLITPGFNKYGLTCTVLDYANPPKEGYNNEFA